MPVACGHRRRPILAALLGSALVLSALVWAPSPAGAADPVRIMPLGDSITEGRAGMTPTYRWFLWHLLAGAGHQVDLVGSRTGVNGGDPVRPDFDQHHEGHSGWRADDLLVGRSGFGRLDQWLATHRPDVVLLHIGTNDLLQCQDVDSTAAEIGRILATIRQVRPDATTLVARILPSTAPGKACSSQVPGRIVELNERIAALAAATSTPAAPVVVVDQHRGFDATTDLRDGIHPTEDAERRMADRWFAALAPRLPASTPTTTTTTTAPPTTPTTTPTPAPTPPRDGYWMLGATGVVHPFGGAAHCGDLRGTAAIDLEPFPDGGGYWILDAGGTVNAVACTARAGRAGGAAFAARLQPGERAVSLSALPDGTGYWLFTDRGRALPSGRAPSLDDMAGRPLNAPVLDSVATPSGRGYWMVAADGGIFAFGDATFSGSTGDRRLNAPVLSVVPDADGRGYWLVAADGGVFAFEAPFLGSMGATRLNSPVRGMVASASGRGYLLVAGDGGAFAFGDVAFRGSLGAAPPPYPIVDIAVRP